MRIVMPILAALSILAVDAGVANATKVQPIGSHSQAEMQATCNASNGQFKAGNGESSMCVTGNSYTSCNENGDCVHVTPSAQKLPHPNRPTLTNLNGLTLKKGNLGSSPGGSMPANTLKSTDSTAFAMKSCGPHKKCP